MAIKLIDINDPNLIESGIVPSLHPLNVPLWADGRNVIFQDGSVQSAQGNIEIFNSVATTNIMGVQDALVSNTPNLLYGTIDSLYRYDGDAETLEGTGYSGSSGNNAFQDNAFQADAFQLGITPGTSLWSMENWGSWVLASNGYDNIQIDKMAGGGAVNLAGTPPNSAKILVRLSVYMLAVNTDLGGAYIEWCDTDNVEDWVTGAAGYLYIRELDSELIAAERLGDVVLAYSYNSVAMIRYIGPDFYFGAKRVLTGIGAVGKFSVVEYKNKHYGFGKDGIWVTDGNSFEYVSPPAMREWLKANVNYGSADKIAGYVNTDKNLIEWGVPIAGASENNLTIIYNVKTNKWSFRSYGILCGLSKGIFEYPVIAVANNILYQDFGMLDRGAMVDCYVRSKPLDGGDPLTWKSIEMLKARVHALAGTDAINIMLAGTNNLELDPDTDLAWSYVTANTTNQLQYFAGADLVCGLYIYVKIIGSGTTAWKFSGIDLFGVPVGSEF